MRTHLGTGSHFPIDLGVLLCLVLVGTMIVGPAAACERAGYSMEVLVDGVPLSEYYQRGTTWIEAIRKAEYSVRLSNHTSGRVAVALSVDGLSSIDTRVIAAERATKWVLDAYQSITVEGWQISSELARRFYFTTEEDSYAAKLGCPGERGVLEAVVFTERERQPITRKQHLAESAATEDGQATRSKIAPEPIPDDGTAATGIGRQVDNPVYRVHFDMEPSPAARIRIHYEYRARLLQLGVLQSPS